MSTAASTAAGHQTVPRARWSTPHAVVSVAARWRAFAVVNAFVVFSPTSSHSRGHANPTDRPNWTSTRSSAGRNRSPIGVSRAGRLRSSEAFDRLDRQPSGCAPRLTLDACGDLAAALYESNRRTEAANLTGLFQDYDRLVGWDHPVTRQTRERLFRMGVRVQQAIEDRSCPL